MSVTDVDIGILKLYVSICLLWGLFALLFLETESHSVSQADLNSGTLLSQPPKHGLSVWATLPLNCKCTHKQIEKRPGKIAKSNKSKNTQPQGWQVGKSIYHTNPI